MANIIFFGNNRLAQGLGPIQQTPLELLLEGGHKIAAIVHRGGKDDLEVDQFARMHKIPVIKSKISAAELKPHQADVGIVAAYGALVPSTVIDFFDHGIINIHPSLLPQYRGPSPIEQAILDGVDKTGVSLMKVTAAMDEGPLYTYKTRQLREEESKQTLAQELLDLGAELTTQILPKVLSSELKPKAQPHPARATYTQKITKDDGRIDWNKPAEQLEREIRAYLGWPGSYTKLADRDVTITMSKVIKKTGQSGEIFIEDGGFGVFCGQDALMIERIKPAGKAEMSGADFKRGYLNRG